MEGELGATDLEASTAEEADGEAGGQGGRLRMAGLVAGVEAVAAADCERRRRALMQGVGVERLLNGRAQKP